MTLRRTLRIDLTYDKTAPLFQPQRHIVPDWSPLDESWELPDWLPANQVLVRDDVIDDLRNLIETLPPRDGPHVTGPTPLPIFVLSPPGHLDLPWEVRMFASGKIVEPRFPLELRPGLTADSLKVVLVDVALGARHDTILFGALTPKLVSEDDGTSAALVVTVKLDQLSRPGTYDLLLKIQPKEQSAVAATRAEPENIELKIVHPEAQLHPPGTLIIEHFCWTPPLLSRDQRPVLKLQETQRESQISQLAVTSLGTPTIDDAPAAGGIGFGDNLPEIQPGESVSLDYEVLPSPKLGVLKGSLQVSPPQLKANVPVSLELRTRLHPFWIVPLALLGVLIGAVARTGLQSRIQSNQQRAQVIALIREMQRLHRRHSDSDFQEKVEKQIDELTTLLSQKGTDFATAVNEYKAALKTAMQRLQASRQEAEMAIRRFAELTETSWFIPPELAKVVQSARKRLNEAVEALQNDEISRAREVLGEIELADDLAGPAGTWQTEVIRSSRFPSVERSSCCVKARGGPWALSGDRSGVPPHRSVRRSCGYNFGRSLELACASRLYFRWPSRREPSARSFLK